MASQSDAEICSAEACPRQWVGDEPPRYEVVIARSDSDEAISVVAQFIGR